MESKALYLALVFWILLISWASADEHVSIKSCVEQIPSSLNLDSGTARCNTPEAAQRLPRDSFKLKLTSGCEGLNSKNFCEGMADACEKKYGKSALKISCFTNRQDTLQSRLEKSGFLAAIKNQSEGYTKQIVNNPTNQTACCNDSASCKECLKSTSLRYLDNYPVQASFCRTLPTNPPVIECTPSGLLGHLNAQGLERELLHELGHVCENCRHSSEGADLGLKPDPIERVTEDLTQVVGPALSKCIVSGLKNAAATRSDRQTDLRGWLREAFADMAFYRNKTELAHWTQDCGKQVTDSHGSPTLELDCLFIQPSFKQGFCN